MKKKFTFIACTLLLIASVLSFKCKKDTVNSFCTTERKTYLSFSESEGIVGYSDKYKRYVVIFDVNNPDNIDESIVGFPCNLADDLKVIGKSVTLSGTLKEFNMNENMSPEIGGQNLYFLELSNIKPKI